MGTSPRDRLGVPIEGLGPPGSPREDLDPQKENFDISTNNYFDTPWNFTLSWERFSRGLGDCVSPRLHFQIRRRISFFSVKVACAESQLLRKIHAKKARPRSRSAHRNGKPLGLFRREPRES